MEKSIELLCCFPQAVRDQDIILFFFSLQVPGKESGLLGWYVFLSAEGELESRFF